jgi:uncharacterized Zn finger protein
LFPAPREIKLSCSCPDGASMCKHVPAALYGVGARLDGKPDLFFTLRGADMQELITAATTTAVVAETGPAAGGLDVDDLSAIFGVEMEAATAPTHGSPTAAPRMAKPAVAKRRLPKRKVVAGTNVRAKNSTQSPTKRLAMQLG